jgi:peroxiredoxin
MVSINVKVPDLELQAYHKDEIKKINLSDYRGKWVVLMFYPGDFTFVCPTELGELADNHDQFKRLGVEVLSASTDSVHSHKAWHDTSKTVNKVRFPMIADPTGNLAKEFGVYKSDEGVAYRGTFVIDPDGIVKAFEIHDNNIGRSVKELLRKLQAAKFVRETKGEACPASWEPGKKALKPRWDLVGKT